MASLAEVRAALADLALRLAEVDPELRRRHTVERSLSCYLTDLDITFSGKLTEDGLQDVTETAIDDAQIRLSVSSDDLIALCAGDLQFASAWARGRLRIDASVLDLLKLRSLI